MGSISLVAWSFHRYRPFDHSLILTNIDSAGVLDARLRPVFGFGAAEMAVDTTGPKSLTLEIVSNPMTPSLSHVSSLFEGGYRQLFGSRKLNESIELFEHLMTMPSLSKVPEDLRDAAMYALATSHTELKNWTAARRWTDAFYGTGRAYVAEPAYRLCRGLRWEGMHAEAYYYYLLARQTLSVDLPEHKHPIH